MSVRVPASVPRTVLSMLPHAGGNVAPTLAILAELAAREHRIVVLGHEQLRQTVEREGFEFHAFERARAWSASVEQPGVRSMAKYLTMASDRGSARDLLRVADQTKPGVILVDCMLPGALKAARSTGLPVVLIMHTLYGYWDAQWSPHTPMGLWLRATSTLPFSRSRRPDAAILTTMPELDRLPEHTRMPRSLIIQTGPPSRAGLADPVADDAPILISLSTISYPGQLELLQRLIDVAADLRVRALVTTGPSLDPVALRAPSSVTVQQFVAHDEIMPTTRLVIGHGGHGTTMRALSHGVPVLVVPMSRYADHQLVGDAVTSAGAGATVSKHASTEELGAVITRTLDDPAIRAGARRIAALLDERDGAAAAADAIEEVAARPRP